LVNKSRAEDAWPYYLTATSLSNYCAYLLTNALVPDNGIVVSKVFKEVKWEIFHATLSSRSRFQSMQDIYNKLMKTVKNPEEVADGEQDRVAKDRATFNEQRVY
jgi:endonuclease III